MAWLGIGFELHGCARSRNLSRLDPFCSYHPYTRGERLKNIWSDLELNPGSLASQATTLSTRPYFLGQLGAML